MPARHHRHDAGTRVTPPPGTTLRNIRVADDLWEAAQTKAAAENTTVSEKIREFLEQWTGDQACG